MQRYERRAIWNDVEKGLEKETPSICWPSEKSSDRISRALFKRAVAPMRESPNDS